ASTCPRAVDLIANMRAWQRVRRTRSRKTSTARQTRTRARQVRGNSSQPPFSAWPPAHTHTHTRTLQSPASGRALCFNSPPLDISLASFRTRSRTMEARLDNYKDLKLKLDGLVPPGHGFHRNLLFDALYSSLPRDPQVKVQIYNAEIVPGGYTNWHCHNGA